ncbi:MAG TPA: hypothetical protein PK858_10195, partial [Saprospiraceae bacterium]|nr:hypothetical protein [Saprospiraceae bacterium]
MKYYWILFLTLPCLASAQNIDAEAWRSDIALLREGLPERMPGAFAEGYSLADFQRDLDALSGTVGRRSDLDIALELQTCVAKLNNPYIRLEFTEIMQKDRVIPIGLGTFADGVFMTGTVKKFERAMRAKVVSVNNVDIEEVQRRLSVFVSKDNEQTMRREVLQWLRFPAAFRKVGISKSDTIYLAVQNARGGMDLLPVYPLDPVRHQKDMVPNIMQPNKPDLRWRTDPLLWDLQWLKSDSVVYFQYNACLGKESALARKDSAMAQQLPEFQPVADSILHIMQRHPNTRFFFDLRFNGGGFSTEGIALANMLADMPAINRKGRLYVAIGWFTGLEAVQIADYFRQNTKAQLLGEPTAERPGHNNPVASFTLPRSSMR